MNKNMLSLAALAALSFIFRPDTELSKNEQKTVAAAIATRCAKLSGPEVQVVETSTEKQGWMVDDADYDHWYTSKFQVPAGEIRVEAEKSPYMDFTVTKLIGPAGACD